MITKKYYRGGSQTSNVWLYWIVL